MKRNIKALLFALFVLAPGWSSAQQLTEPTIRRMISEMDDAIFRRDAGGVAKFLSEKLTVTLTIKVSGQTQNLTMNKSTYIDSIKKGWATATDYQYKRRNLLIELSSDTKAVVTADVSEILKVDGQTIRSNTTETAVIELVRGKPLIVSVVGNVQM